MNCQNCGAENAKNAIFCNKCGKSLLDTDTCQKCGASNNKDAIFCEKCGNVLKLENISDSESVKKSKKLLIGVISGILIIVIATSIIVFRPYILRSKVDDYIYKMQCTKALETYEKLPSNFQDDTEYLYISILADLEKGNYTDVTSKLLTFDGYDKTADLVDSADEIMAMISEKFDLPQDLSYDIADKIDYIALEAVEEEEKEFEKKIDNNLVGTWIVTAISSWENVDKGVWDYVNVQSNIYGEMEVNLTDRYVTFYSDGTYECRNGGSNFFSESRGEATYYTDDGYIYNTNSEGSSFETQYTISDGKLICRTYGHLHQLERLEDLDDERIEELVILKESLE